MARDYSAEYEARVERAMEAGFESYAEQRYYRAEVDPYRSLDIETRDELASFTANYEIGSMSFEDIIDTFDDAGYFDAYSVEDFYRYLRENVSP